MDAHDGKLKLPGSYELVNNVTRAWEHIQDAAAAHLSEGREIRAVQIGRAHV